MMISFEFYQANIHHPLLCCCSRSGVEEEYTEQDQLLQEVLEKWNEKAVHKEQKEAEKRSAASGREEVLRLRAEAVAMYRKKRKAGDDAVQEEEPSEDREEVDASEGGGKRRRLDLNKIINRRLQQKDEELELRRKELELAQEKRKEEAEERKLFMAMMKKQAGL